MQRPGLKTKDSPTTNEAELSAFAFALAGIMLIGLALFSIRSEAFLTTQSLRRAASPSEASSVVSLYSNCRSDRQGTKRCPLSTGFFVKNSQNRMLVMLSRHAVKYKLQEACNNNQIKVYFKNAYVGSCRHVLVSQQDFDIGLMEVSFGPAHQEVLSQIRPLRVSTQVGTILTPLKTIGFPIDPARKGSLTVSENCWTGSDPFPWRELRSKANIVFARKVQGSRSNLLLHNCSVYNGNSGGPLIDKNSGAVVALTNFHDPGLNQNGYPVLHAENNYYPAEALGNFLAANRLILKSLGISIF